MTGARRGPYRIALRIYVVTVAAVLTTAAALFLVLKLAHERGGPERRDFYRDVARYAAGRVAARWTSEAAIRGEVAALEADLHVPVAAYRSDGSLVYAAGPRPPALGPPELDRLAAREALERRDGSFRMPKQIVFPVIAAGKAVGYVVLAPPGPPRMPLPPELLLLAVVLVSLGVGAAVLGASIAGPLDRLARTARALGSGDLAARTGVRRNDELGAVARAFDEMAERVVGLLRAQTELIANVAHELRTPLARIRVALDLAAEGDAAVARESLAEIGEDLVELEGLVNDVLASARMELAGSASGAPPLHRGAVAPGEVVARAAERLRHASPDRAVQVSVAPGLPALVGDAALLRRALDNLLDNARKYSPPDSAIEVRASATPAAVVIEVVDRGEGIAAEDLERVFAPFFRADRSRARATGGVGLGLALSRRIVEAHGGTLVARSAPAEATTFTMTLPVVPDGAQRGERAASPSGP